MTIEQNSARSPAIAVVYLSALLQGMTLVSFPASSAVLKQSHGFTDAQYGAIFLPQVALAVFGAIGGGILARRLGLKNLLWFALFANALSQGLLALSAGLDPTLAYTCILIGTSALGLGFGISGAPLNSYPPLLFPKQRNTAVVALHTSVGMGLMIGPLLASALSRHWVVFPLLLCAIALLLAIASTITSLPQQIHNSPNSEGRHGKPSRSTAFWLFVVIAVFYAFAEGTFSNWAVIYLQESKQLPQTIAALSLSIFWGALVVGRLLVSLLLLRIAAETLWRTLPPLMIAAFLVLPYANTIPASL